MRTYWHLNLYAVVIFLIKNLIMNGANIAVTKISKGKTYRTCVNLFNNASFVEKIFTIRFEDISLINTAPAVIIDNDKNLFA